MKKSGFHFFIVLCLLATGTANIFSQDSFNLSRSTFNQKKYNESILTIAQYGYYSIRTKSKHSTSFVVVNQMTGPGDLTQSSGNQDARQDMLLDEGKYKIRMYGNVESEDSLRLEVKPFTERNSPQAPVLNPDQYIETELGDLEQISYWIEVKEDNQEVYLEMQGRNLAQVVIWKDASWLENVKTFKKTVEYDTGRPLSSIIINTTLPKGYYKVTAYGGPEKKWANQSSSHPFRLHYGLEKIAPNSRFADTISSYGVNRYLIDGSADFYLLQASEKKPYKLKVQSLSVNEDFDRYDNVQSITKKSRTPQCYINRSYYNRLILVSVEGSPGDPFVLQSLYKSQSMYVRPDKTAQYWVSTVHTGFIGDNVDASGFLLDSYGEDTVLAKDMPLLTMKQGWTRKFNLLETVTVYFDVKQGGSYEIDYSGTTAQTKIERFFTSYPKDYRSPQFESGKRVVKLEKGIHILSIRPEKKGIITFQLKPKGLSLTKKKESPFQAGIQIPSVSLNRKHSYKFYLGQQGEVKTGVQLRELPLDLRQSFSVYLIAGQSIDIPSFAHVNSVLKVSSESSSPYEITEKGQPIKAGVSELDKGQHTLTLKNKGSRTEMFSLQYVDAESLPSARPQYLSTQVMDSFPEFDTIVADKVRYIDLDQDGRKVFLLKVDKAGIYKVQSTGLLKTKATMRDRLIPSMGSASANGPGRNFLLQSFLKEGIYQISIETLGKSAGHLGVLLEYIAPQAGGELVLDKTMKATVSAGDSLIYTFNIEEQHNYQIRTIGMGREYPCRLEDSQGYPLYRPGKNTDFNVEFRPGSYRLISLPQEVEGKRLTSFKKSVAVPAITGKGPIPLALNSRHYNTWKESDSEKREPDVYTFSLPATMPVTIHFPDTMWARLYDTTGGRHKQLKKIYPDDDAQHELPAGTYSLELMALRKGNFVDYTLDLSTSVLVDGLSYETSPGRTFDVIVEVPGLVEFSSEGKSDVYAELFDDRGNVLEVVDDSLNDWNFIFSRMLAAAKYKLKVSSRSGYGKVRVSMNILKNVTRQALTPLTDKKIDLQNRKNLFPLSLSSGFYHINIDANSQMAMSLMKKNKDRWLDMSVINGQDLDWYFYLPANKSYGISLWSLDHIDENIHLSIQSYQARSVSMADLNKGLTLTPQKGKVALSADIDQAGSYRVECVDVQTGDNLDGVAYATMKDSSHSLVWEKVRNDFISSGKGTLYINIATEKQLRLKLTPVTLETTESLGVSLMGGEKAFVRLPQNSKGMSLILARSSMGQPLVSWTGGDSSIKMKDGTLVNNGFAFHHGSALTVSLDTDPGAVLVWNPIPEIAESGISLQYYNLSMNSASPFEQRTEASVEPLESRTYKQGSAAYFEVALAPGMAVFTWNESGVIEIHYSYQSQALFQFIKKAKQITIVNLGSSPSRFHLEQRRSVASLQKGSLLVENTFSRSGYVEQEIVARKYFTRLYSSPNLRISLLDASGTMTQSLDGTALDIKPGYYRYVLEHKAEYSKAWMGSDLLMDRWGLKKPSGVQRLDSPGFVDVGTLKWYKLATSGPSVLQMSSQNDFVAALVVDGKFSAVSEVIGPDSTVAYIPEGIVLIGLRAPAQKDSGGGNVYVNWRPVEDIKSSMEKTLLLTDNNARAFTFDLTQKQEVAVGYNAPSDLIDCQLYNSRGELVADGPVIFTELDAGKYIVIYNLREDLEFSEFSPVYVDTKTIEDTILADKVRAFLIKYGYIKGNN